MTRFLFIIVFFATLSVCCKFKRDKNISIHFLGEIGFRRSYANIQFMDNDKEIEKFLEKQYTTKPSFSYTENQSLKNRFEMLGLISNDEILLNRFDFTTKEENQVTDNNSNVIKILFQKSPDTGTRWLSLSSGKYASKIKIDAHFMELKYSIMDIIPGGNKEIVVLSEYYIMNGDNFDFLVYEIK